MPLIQTMFHKRIDYHTHGQHFYGLLSYKSLPEKILHINGILQFILFPFHS